MTKIAYKEHNFKPESLQLIRMVNNIIDSYTQKGYSLTLRQVYYQLVARDVIKNNDKSYDNLGALLNNARLAGLVSWKAIEDRTRNLRGKNHWNNPSEIIYGAAWSFNLDKWEGQEYRVEVWVEKDALVDVVGRACERLDVKYFSCRGYVSQSEMWSAAQRLHGYVRDDQTPVIIHLGDHDPSGIDMSRDIQERLDVFGVVPIFERVALNMDQIEEYDPPPNPAKLSDSRARGYIELYGDDSWELDALQPEVIDGLITEKVKTYLDDIKYNAIAKEQEEGQGLIRKVANDWDNVVRFVNGPDDDDK